MSLHQSLKSRLKSVERWMLPPAIGDDGDSQVSTEVADSMIKAGLAWGRANGFKASELEEWADDIPAEMAERMIAAGLKASGADTGPTA